MEASQSFVTIRERPRQLVVAATAVLFTMALLGPLLVGIRTSGFHLFWFRLYLPFYAAVLAWFVWTRRNALRPLPTTIWLFVAFGAWVLLSALWAIWSEFAFGISWLFFTVSGLFVGGAVYLTTSDERTVARYLLVVFALVAAGEIIALIEIYTGWHLPTARLAGEYNSGTAYIGVDMASAWFNNRNNFAFFLTLTLGPLFAAALRADVGRLARVLGLIPIGLVAFIMWANRSRTALVTMVIILGSVLVLAALESRLRSRSWTPPQHSATILTGLVFLTAIVSVAVLWFAPNPISTVGSSLWTRWQLGVAALNLFIETNGFGVGVGAFPSAIAASPVDTNGVLAPHNWLLYLIGTFGIIGTGLFLAAYARLLYDLFVSAVETGRWIHIGLFGSMLALPVGALGPSNALHTHTFWLFIGLAAAATYRPLVD